MFGATGVKQRKFQMRADTGLCLLKCSFIMGVQMCGMFLRSSSHKCMVVWNGVFATLGVETACVAGVIDLSDLPPPVCVCWWGPWPCVTSDW